MAIWTGEGSRRARTDEIMQESAAAQTAAILEEARRDAPLVGAFRSGPDGGRPRVGEKEIARAIDLLTEYKKGKTMLERRVVDDELWWELRHWEVMRRGRDRCKEPEVRAEPTSAWLFNAIVNKHADAMDNYPEPVVLPRERSDEESARVLSSILPVVLEYNDFE